MEQAKYIPGTCNIGIQERKLRRMVGWIGTALYLALMIYFHLAAFPKWANYFLFIPALLGAMGLLQDYAHFCVNFGLRGLFNVDKEAFQTDTVLEDAYRTLDRQKAWGIIFTGVGIGLAAILLACTV